MISAKNEPKVAFKIWLECGGQPVLGSGGAQILQAIKTEGSISAAARKTGMSYRYIWNYLERIEKRLPKPPVTKLRGGKTGGGA